MNGSGKTSTSTGCHLLIRCCFKYPTEYSHYCETSVVCYDIYKLFAIQSWQLICVRENIHLNLSVAGHLDEDFRQPMYLCPVDLRKLQTLCGLNVIDRYQGLCGFFRKHGMNEEADWTGRRIEFIKNKNAFQ